MTVLRLTMSHSAQKLYNKLQAIHAARRIIRDGRAAEGGYAGLRWIEPYLNHTDSTGVFANLFLADLKSQKKKGKHPPPKDVYEATQHYRFVAQHTINSKRYVYVVEQLLTLDDSEDYRGRGLVGRLEDHKAVAKYTKNGASKDAALLKVGELYLQLKDYDKANLYFRHLSRRLPEKDPFHTKASELLIENTWWQELKDALF